MIARMSPVYARRRVRAMRAARVRSGLGDDLPPDVTGQMLDTLRGVRQDIADRLAREELQKWIQIAATISIPIAAWAWRMILGRRRADKMEI